MKIYQRIFLLGFFLAPISVYAVSLTNDTTLTLPSTGDSYTLSSNSTFDSLVINSNNFAFTMAAGQSVTLTSADKRNFSASPAGSSSGTCDVTSSNFTLTASGSTTAYTITPSGTCGSSSSGGGSSGGGGGGGGGGGAPAVPPQTPASTSGASAAQKALIEQLQSQIASIMAQIAALKGVPSLPPQASPVAGIARTLAFGAQGNDVTLLQEYLALDPSIYPEGIVSGYFGRLTSAAVKRFQKKHGIDQVGVVGPMTRAKLNELMAQ